MLAYIAPGVGDVHSFLAQKKYCDPHFLPQVRMDPDLYKDFLIANVDENLAEWGEAILTHADQVAPGRFLPLLNQWGPDGSTTIFEHSKYGFHTDHSMHITFEFSPTCFNQFVDLFARVFATDYAAFRLLGFNWSAGNIPQELVLGRNRISLSQEEPVKCGLRHPPASSSEGKEYCPANITCDEQPKFGLGMSWE